MDFFTNLSIRNKLVTIILVSTVSSLALGFLVVVYTGVNQLRDDLIRTTELVAQAVGNYSAVALAFDDRTEAQAALAPLDAFVDITDAYLYDRDGQLFETYSRTGALHLPPKVLVLHSEIRGGYIHHFRPVEFDGKRWGTIYLRASAESLDQRTREYVTYMAVLLLALVALALVSAYGLQAFISKPILELAAQAQSISDDADYTVRVDKPGDDEIGQLYDGFNAMLTQIEYRQGELERSNRDLDQFAYVASHDLKAPLRAISTLAGWIEEDLRDSISDEVRDQLHLLRSRVSRMDGLIEGILQYSRVGRVGSEPETVDVGELLSEVVEALAPADGFDIRIGSDMPVMVAKRLPLEQVFANLINNAIKYHHQDRGTIEISAEAPSTDAEVGDRAEFYRFTVADDGPGIAEQHHARIFQMFQTLQPRDRVESTGLGLALVTKLVEAEGGVVSVDSAPGAGSRFSFTWPRRPAADSASGSTIKSVHYDA